MRNDFAFLHEKLSIIGMARTTVTRPPAPRLDFWSSLHIELLTCYDGRTTIRQPVANKPEYLSAWLIRGGWIDVDAGGKRTRATPGQWVFPGPGHLVQGSSKQLKLLSIAFYAHTPMRACFLGAYRTIKLRAESCADLEKHAVTLVRYVEKQFPGRAWNTYKEPATFEQFAAIRSRFAKWFEVWCAVMQRQGVWITPTTQIDTRVQRALDAVWRSPLDELANLDRLPAKLGISRDSLDRLLLRDTGRTLHQTRQLRLLEESRSLLQSDEVLIKQVAFMLGFKTVAHFSRWFSQHAGESPRVFRRRCVSE